MDWMSNKMEEIPWLTPIMHWNTFNRYNSLKTINFLNIYLFILQFQLSYSVIKVMQLLIFFHLNSNGISRTRKSLQAKWWHLRRKKAVCTIFWGVGLVGVGMGATDGVCQGMWFLGWDTGLRLEAWRKRNIFCMLKFLLRQWREILLTHKFFHIYLVIKITAE